MNNKTELEPLPQQLVDLLASMDSVKILATLNEDGTASIETNPTIDTLDGRTIILSEELEKSSGSKNLVRSIWFDKPVTIFAQKGVIHYEVHTKVNRCLIVGKIFDEMLKRARQIGGSDADIAAAWELIPEKVRNVSPDLLRLEQKSAHPYFNSHLDRTSIKREYVV
jgi:hypothetical protein